MKNILKKWGSYALLYLIMAVGFCATIFICGVLVRLIFEIGKAGFFLFGVW